MLGENVVRDKAFLPPVLLNDLRRCTKLTPPMPDVMEYYTCGCDDQAWGLVVLCNYHEGYAAALEAGYRDGYEDALAVIDRVERNVICDQEGVVMDGLNGAVEVPLWAVLYAVRYGLARQTYACGDAARLAYEFWDRFPEHVRDQIQKDVERVDPVCAGEWAWLQQR